jgi:hypothetical protein
MIIHKTDKLGNTEHVYANNIEQCQKYLHSLNNLKSFHIEIYENLENNCILIKPSGKKKCKIPYLKEISFCEEMINFYEEERLFHAKKKDIQQEQLALSRKHHFLVIREQLIKRRQG